MSTPKTQAEPIRKNRKLFAIYTESVGGKVAVFDFQLFTTGPPIEGTTLLDYQPMGLYQFRGNVPTVSIVSEGNEFFIVTPTGEKFSPWDVLADKAVFWIKAHAAPVSDIRIRQQYGPTP